MKLKTIVCSLALAIVPSLSLAGTTGNQVISKVEVNEDGVIALWGQSGDWNNKDACTSSEFVVVLPDNFAYSEIYALLLASYSQGKQVGATTKECHDLNQDGTTYPIITTNVKSL